MSRKYPGAERLAVCFRPLIQEKMDPGFEAGPFMLLYYATYKVGCHS